MEETKRITGVLEVEEGEVRGGAETNTAPEGKGYSPIQELNDMANSGMVSEVKNHPVFDTLSTQSKMLTLWRGVKALAGVKREQASSAAKKGEGWWDTYIRLNEDAMALEDFADLIAASSVGNMPSKLDKKSRQVDF